MSDYPTCYGRHESGRAVCDACYASRTCAPRQTDGSWEIPGPQPQPTHTPYPTYTPQPSPTRPLCPTPDKSTCPSLEEIRLMVREELAKQQTAR